jgi:hypothetical protein
MLVPRSAREIVSDGEMPSAVDSHTHSIGRGETRTTREDLERVLPR